ncbi:MAG TPA: hypothetical protein VI382_07195, partial [Candidatus Manganitrophaceae bacterium]|nr:hypothetical protein [Candidatus Manganitrophaceae bacterium]
MKLIPSTNLSETVAAIVAATTFTVITIGFILISRVESQKSIEQMKQQATVLGESIQRAMVQAIEDSEESVLRIRETIRDLGKLEGVEEIAIFGPEIILIGRIQGIKHEETTSAYKPTLEKLWESGMLLSDEEDSPKIMRIRPPVRKKGETGEAASVVVVRFRQAAGEYQSIIEVIRPSSQSGVWKALSDLSRSQESLQRLAEDLGRLQGVVSIEVYDPTYTLIAHNSKEKVGEKALEDSA